MENQQLTITEKNFKNIKNINNIHYKNALIQVSIKFNIPIYNMFEIYKFMELNNHYQITLNIYGIKDIFNHCRMFDLYYKDEKCLKCELEHYPCEECEDCFPEEHFYCDNCESCFEIEHYWCNDCDGCFPGRHHYCDNCDTCSDTFHFHCERCADCFSEKHYYCERCEDCFNKEHIFYCEICEICSKNEHVYCRHCDIRCHECEDINDCDICKKCDEKKHYSEIRCQYCTKNLSPKYYELNEFNLAKLRCKDCIIHLTMKIDEEEEEIIIYCVYCETYDNKIHYHCEYCINCDSSPHKYDRFNKKCIKPDMC